MAKTIAGTAIALVIFGGCGVFAGGATSGGQPAPTPDASGSVATPSVDPSPVATESVTATTGPTSTSTSTATATTDPSSADITAARAGLATLRWVERHPDDVPDYDRDAFGESWADTDGNGCNQRDDVLLRDVLPGTVVVQQQDACDHDVLAGSWLDPYTGALLTFDDLKDSAQAQAIQIDHVVPLAEAWQSGASAWTEERRESYANDVDGLLAVDGPTNASKGADDPAVWRPRKDFQCAYGVRWILTKLRWDLAADDSEIAGLAELLDVCP